MSRLVHVDVSAWWLVLFAVLVLPFLVAFALAVCALLVIAAALVALEWDALPAQAFSFTPFD